MEGLEKSYSYSCNWKEGGWTSDSYPGDGFGFGPISFPFRGIGPRFCGRFQRGYISETTQRSKVGEPTNVPWVTQLGFKAPLLALACGNQNFQKGADVGAGTEPQVVAVAIVRNLLG